MFLKYFRKCAHPEKTTDLLQVCNFITKSCASVSGIHLTLYRNITDSFSSDIGNDWICRCKYVRQLYTTKRSRPRPHGRHHNLINRYEISVYR
jgi:hypothetical protein